VPGLTMTVDPQSVGDRGSDAEQLCDLLLTLAGKNTGRMQTAIIHARVLEEAFPLMTREQQAIARARLTAIETKWGSLFWDDQISPENGGIPPETRVANWLSTRRHPERLLYVLRRAAICIDAGQTSMSRIMDYAYAKETDLVIYPVGQTSFTEWMLELRIGKRSSKGAYTSGPLCRWWVKEMVPSREKSSPYAACLKQLETGSTGKRLWR
jgi:hypothetical protein